MTARPPAHCPFPRAAGGDSDTVPLNRRRRLSGADQFNRVGGIELSPCAAVVVINEDAIERQRRLDEEGKQPRQGKGRDAADLVFFDWSVASCRILGRVENPRKLLSTDH